MSPAPGIVGYSRGGIPYHNRGRTARFIVYERMNPVLFNPGALQAFRQTAEIPLRGFWV